MGSNYVRETSEIVGLLMLSKLAHLFQDNSVGLYRDDGLGVFRDLSGPETEGLEKILLRCLKSLGLASQVKQI